MRPHLPSRNHVAHWADAGVGSLPAEHVSALPHPCYTPILLPSWAGRGPTVSSATGGSVGKGRGWQRSVLKVYTLSPLFEVLGDTGRGGVCLAQGNGSALSGLQPQPPTPSLRGPSQTALLGWGWGVGWPALGVHGDGGKSVRGRPQDPCGYTGEEYGLKAELGRGGEAGPLFASQWN